MSDKLKTREELVQIWIEQRLKEIPTKRMPKAEREGRLSELRMIQVIAGRPENAESSVLKSFADSEIKARQQIVGDVLKDKLQLPAEVDIVWKTSEIGDAKTMNVLGEKCGLCGVEITKDDAVTKIGSTSVHTRCKRTANWRRKK